MICPTPTPANYNVRSHASLDEIADWVRQTKFKIAVFENFDGGGFNHYIVEFRTVKAFRAFERDFGVYGEPWAEDSHGKRTYWDPYPESDDIGRPGVRSTNIRR